MGKNYAENSLKRFLKRKVKITLGVVVSFLITGVVAFADEEMANEFIEELKNQNIKLEEIKENFKGLGSSNLETKDYPVKENGTGTDKTIKVSYDKNTGINKIEIPSDISSLGNIEIKDNLLTSNTKTAILNALKGEKYSLAPLKSAANDNSIGTNIQKNEGIILSESGGKEIAQTGDNLENDGILGGFQNLENGTAINNGLIYATISRNQAGGQQYGDAGFSGKSTKDITLINNGLIIIKTDKYGYGQYYYDNKNNIKGQLINNGVISSKTTGQFFRVGQGKLYNYGIIEAQNGQIGQQHGKTTESYNYGTIDVSEEITGIKAGIGQSEGVLYNYGLIKVTDGLAMQGTNSDVDINVYNYGVIKSSGKSNIFSGKTESNGIVISKNADNLLDKDWAKDTAIFSWGDNNSYTLKNGVELKDKVTNESFGEENKIGAVVNGTAEIEGVIKDKNITSIISGDTGKTTVFTSKGDELVLENTNITGYFENKDGGTVLDTTASDLTLSGKVNITAVKDLQNKTGEVIAVEVGKDKTFTIVGNDVKINGIVKGAEGADIEAYALGGSMEVSGGNVTISNILDENIKSEYVKENNFINKAELSGDMDNLTFNFSNTSINKETGESKLNEVIVKDGTTINANGKFTDETEAGNRSQVTIENVNKFTENLTDFTFGAGDNTVIVNNDKEFTKLTDLGAGNDTFTVKYGETASYKDEQAEKPVEIGYSVFDYKVNNAENVVLSGKGQWAIGENAHIGFTDNGTKAGNTALLKAADGATLNIIMREGGSNLNKMIESGQLLEKGDQIVLGTDKDSLIKYQIGASGLPFKTEDTTYTAKYGIEKDANVVAPIFNVVSDGKTTSISLKTAEQAGVGNYAPIYNAYIKQVANKNWDVIKYINSLNSDEDLTDRIIKTNVSVKAYYTAGTIVTKNITDSYLSAVEDFTKRAEKGQWLAQGKYINSDTEFDGGSKVKGYEGDINSAVGMVEYGFTENTSYGVAFGGGDTTVDIDGGGKLDGDNYYLGFYTKHRTANGIDLVGNFGIMKSDLDSSLGNEFAFTVNNSEVSDKTFEKGTADSTAFALLLKGKKDFYVTDSVKLQPVLGARMTLINQDKAENPAMNFEIKEQDVFIAEGILGVNAAKEFALSNGKVEFNTGIEYAFAASTENDDAEYRLFADDDIKIENSKIASSKGTFHIGADYEHENGVGFNGKYEMMWSDKGDDSRITAGISYRF